MCTSLKRLSTVSNKHHVRISRPRFASKVDEKNDLSKTVTPHYLPKVIEFSPAKPQHVNAPSFSRNNKKESYDSNDMAHTYFLEEARKKTQDRNRILNPRDMASDKTHHTPNACTPKPRNISRSLHVSKNSCVTSNVAPLVDHYRKSSSFSDSKNFVCATCQKCVFNANHDSCITKFLKESSTVYEKPSPRSGLRWKPTGRIFETVGLRWIPTGKLFASSTTKVNSEPPHGSTTDITNPYECEQTINVSASFINLATGIHNEDGNPSSVNIKQHCDSILQVGNPVKEILLKLNLPDHRSILTDYKIRIKMVWRYLIPAAQDKSRFIATCSYLTDIYKDIMKAQPIPAMPIPPAGQVIPLDVLATHTNWVKASKEIAGLMLMTMEPDIQKNLEQLGAYDMLREFKTLFAQQAEQELIQTMREFHVCNQEEG
ncbi:hypothetical protein Tco_1475213 [Tanacetum coccineum]